MSDLNIDIGVNYKKINGTETLFLFWNNKNVNAMIASRFSALKLNVLLQNWVWQVATRWWFFNLCLLQVSFWSFAIFTSRFIIDDLNYSCIHHLANLRIGEWWVVKHSVWKSQKKSHLILRAKRATFIFLLKMPKIVNFGVFKTDATWQTVLPD